MSDEKPKNPLTDFMDDFSVNDLPPPLRKYLADAIDEQEKRRQMLEDQLRQQAQMMRHKQNQLDADLAGLPVPSLSRLQQQASRIMAPKTPDPDKMFAQRLHNAEVRLAEILDKIGPLLLLLEQQKSEQPKE